MPKGTSTTVAAAAIVLVLALAAVPATVAGPPAHVTGDGTPPGQIECKEHTVNCGKKPKTVNGDVHVNDGERREFHNGVFIVTGNITVHDGGTLTVRNADVYFACTSNGILVESGGTFVAVRASLQPEDPTCAFSVVAEDASTIDWRDARIDSAEVVLVRTDDALVRESLFTGSATGLTLEGSDADVEDSVFRGSAYGIHSTGGAPTMDGNDVAGSDVCIRNEGSNPTITGNTLHCHVGIEHIDSHSTISGNTLLDDGSPFSFGLFGKGGARDEELTGVVVEGNTFTNFATAIFVEDGRAFVRNNTITGNVGDGIVIVRNLGSLDVRGNGVSANGGHGIRLEDTANVTVVDNVVESNGADGVHAVGGENLVLERNVLRANGGSGGVVASVAGVTSADDTAEMNVVDGLRVVVDAGEGSVALARPTLTANGRDGLRNEGSGDVLLTFGTFGGNGGFGARTLSLDAVVTAPLSYWGHVTGPQHPLLNPAGQGDEVSDGVVFVPFLPAPP